MNNSLEIIFVGVVVLCVLLVYVSNRWLIPWYAERRANELLKTAKDGKLPESREYRLEIAFNSTSFSVKSIKESGNQTAIVPWSTIQRVTAFKRDLLTVDCICLLFATVDGTGIELDEEMKRWNELLETLPKFLPGCKPLSEWIFQVGSPAFATNQVEIYSRAA